MNVKLLVVENHTLGYITELQPNIVQLLSTSALKGSPFSLDNSTVYVKDRKIRLATEQDFADFRVSFKGYAADKLYTCEYDKQLSPA